MQFSVISSFHSGHYLETMVCNLGYKLKSPGEYYRYSDTTTPLKPHQLNVLIVLNFASVVVEKEYLSVIFNLHFSYEDWLNIFHVFGGHFCIFLVNCVLVFSLFFYWIFDQFLKVLVYIRDINTFCGICCKYFLLVCHLSFDFALCFCHANYSFLNVAKFTSLFFYCLWIGVFVRKPLSTPGFNGNSPLNFSSTYMVFFLH